MATSSTSSRVDEPVISRAARFDDTAVSENREDAQNEETVTAGRLVRFSKSVGLRQKSSGPVCGDHRTSHMAGWTRTRSCLVQRTSLHRRRVYTVMDPCSVSHVGANAAGALLIRHLPASVQQSGPARR